MNEKFLPIGSVVLLKDGLKKLMVVGFCPESLDSSNAKTDYLGCLYPEGIFSQDLNFMFNHDQIAEVCFKGFENEEELNFKKNLNDLITNGTLNGQPVDSNLLPNNSIPASNINQPLQSSNAMPEMFNSNN